jgi:hypothetical protein
MNNPFQYGRELGAADLVDRESEIAEVVSTIHEGGKLFLIGPRRYGKTSILQAAQTQAEKDGAVVLRYDAEVYPSLDLLARAILVEATERLSTNLEKVGTNVKKFFARLKPELSFNAADLTLSGSLGVTAKEENKQQVQVTMLVDLLTGLEKLAAEAKRPVGLMLDEFQKIIELGGAEAEGQIRGTIQRHKYIGYVFAGSKTRMLADMTGHPSRPFYRLGERRFIGAVPRPDFTVFLTQGFRQAGIKTTDDVIAHLMDLAEDVPYCIQRLAHACWDSLQGVRAKSLTKEIVERELEILARQDDPYYSHLWNELTAVQQKALIAAIRERGQNLLSQQTAKAYQLSPSSIQRALQTLREREILRTEESLGNVALRLEDPFFGVWIRLITAKA